MKAKDSMIGDWVNVGQGCIMYSVYKDKPQKVVSVFPKGVGIGAAYVPIEYIEPIPLTPEILEKNGWKREFDKKAYMVKYDLSVEGKNCWMMWAIKEHNLDIQRQDEKLNMYNLKTQRVCIPCDYVHELQHALKLCGIEKEITL